MEDHHSARDAKKVIMKIKNRSNAWFSRELHCKTNDMADNLSVYKKDSLDQSVLLFTLYDHPLLENLICGFSNSSDYERSFQC